MNTVAIEEEAVMKATLETSANLKSLLTTMARMTIQTTTQRI